MRHKPEADPTTPPLTSPGRSRSRSCSRCARAACRRSCGSARASPTRAPGRSRAVRSKRTRRSRRRSGATSRRRSTSERSRTWSSSARGASPAEIRRTENSRPPSSASFRPASTPSSPRTPPGSPSTSLPALAFDHGEIVLAGRERLRGKLSYTNIGFALAPPSFTLSELRGLYAAALGHDVSATNLKRVLLRRNVLEATGSRREPGRTGGRPAEVYRFRVRALEITDPFATLRPPG